MPNIQSPNQNSLHPPKVKENLNSAQDKTTSQQLEADWSFATQELLDTLPQVWTRGLLYFIIIFVSIALPWAAFSKVDETGSSRGRLEPKKDTVKVDASVTGTIASIEVEEGQSVQKGEVLITLDSELARAELEQLQRELVGQRDRLSLLKVLKNQLSLAVRTQEQQNQAQALEKKAQIEQTRQNLETLKLVYDLQKNERQAQVSQAKEALNKNESVLRSAQIKEQGIQEKLKRYKTAFEGDVISQDRYLDVQTQAQTDTEQVTKAKTEIEQAKLRLEEIQNNYQKSLQEQQSEIEQVQLRLKEQKSSYESLKSSGKLSVLKTQEQVNNLEAEITTLSANIGQNESRVESLQYKLKQRTIKAPQSGIVFDLAISQQGQVVQTGRDIAEIAPLDSSLILKAEMATAESGSLELGMPVKMKFDAYPYQDYGIVKGKLSKISPTSKMKETPEGEVAIYDISVSLSQDCLPSGDKCIPLGAGDTATAEVVVRQRRIIDFILDPFRKLQKGGFKL